MTRLVPPSPRPLELPALLLCWASLTPAGAFVAWTATSSPAELADADVGFPRLLGLLGPAALAAAVACGGLSLARAEAWLPRFAVGAGFGYAGCLSVAGLAAAPWVGAGLAVVGALLLPSTVRMTTAIFTGQMMAGMTGLYLTLNLNKFLASTGPFINILRALKLLLTG